MATEAVKITYGATTVTFDKDEVLDAVWGREQDYQVHAKQDEAPGMNYTGSETDSLSITFDLQRTGTIDKIDQILECGEELTVYPAMQFDETMHFHVIPLINGTEEVETFGEIEAVTRTVKFIESDA